MKLRCVQNSIRLRIRKSDMEQLQAKGLIQESVSFPSGNGFGFALATDKTTEQVTANFENNQVQVFIPLQIANQWMDSNELSLEHEQNLPNGEILHILIEKDLPCLDRPEEDKSDTFQELAEEKDLSC